MSTTSGYGNAESILVRAGTWKTAFKAMTLFAGLMTVVATGATATAVYLALERPEPRYFATTNEGQIQPLIPLDRPHLSAAAVSNFAVNAVTASLTYSFDQYRPQFQDAQQWFTQPAGWNSFVGAVDESGMLDLVRERRFNSSAVAQNAVITTQGINASGIYEWVVQMPVRITYQSASELSGQTILVTVRLSRLQTYQSPYAMAISQYVAAPGS
ncbi:type IVB secretion system apparatus protein IcmL/DotI [Aurantimonas sp. C2-6-R+9]|uniref:type IVB secretion system apparatus protein IcmL/DotI n=1 Tax=unclassified Aurantimonas TaxID=2638230 RepID=UPI002E173944|nr:MULTISPECIES: type IVB secretion system apparatus protein IcmL/DotI [unclassified Aurantimonas]MEC5291942.1 type IVB secretion system apparatus protein IcmL/DotI [Aurantimonas sp. C2-3-R2]MEC5382751.1 type IVB secretion system apparatus protein IcmL/DotI [Aurantimonas sp. C2-6-R+9]MEC5413028.1 type IVB secretion system apparatus protein IcmL/DotI [Aurantimonas sp. C2-4-R8]